MQTLVPFQQKLPFGLKADLIIQGTVISIEYQLDQGLMAILGLPAQSQQWNPQSIQRADGLWKTTCFEAFLKPKGLRSYYEFNFSLLPAWNAYEFQDYRKPQPPQPTNAFVIKSMNWNANAKLLSVQIENQSKHHAFDVSLTCVTEDPAHTIQYWAVTQAIKEPDFHAPETFTLARTSL